MSSAHPPSRELSREILAQQYQQRRQRLLDELPADTVVVLKGATLVTRSHDTEYPFRQSSDFYYLTGINEPDATLLMIKPNRPNAQPRSYLFVLPRDLEQETWNGRRLGTQLAGQISGIEQVYENKEANRRIMQALGQHQQVCWPLQVSLDEQNLRHRWLSTLTESRKLRPPRQYFDLNPYVHAQRLIKSPVEIALLRESARIAVDAHIRAMQKAEPGMYEYQLAAEIHHEFAVQGAAGPAYGTICGSGENACILHYTDNNMLMHDGQLVLIDAGCEYQGYASDITRTFPVNGRFTDAQRRLYNWVLKAQQAAIAHIKPGNTLPQAYKIAAHILTEGLIDLGVLSGSVQENIHNTSYRPYFMHGLGHWLGLDVHDVGEYNVNGEPRPLEPGMVLTIEPGLYIPKDTQCDPELRGLGVRIEDNLLVTATGHDNLTAGVPVEVDAIEALMAGPRTKPI